MLVFMIIVVVLSIMFVSSSVFFFHKKKKTKGFNFFFLKNMSNILVHKDTTKGSMLTV